MLTLHEWQYCDTVWKNWQQNVAIHCEIYIHCYLRLQNQSLDEVSKRIYKILVDDTTVHTNRKALSKMTAKHP